jgi:hypothetical protein
MIATAFADFRRYLPIFRPYSERSQYYSLFGLTSTRPSLNPQLFERLLLDIEGLILTAIHFDIDILVTGAVSRSLPIPPFWFPLSFLLFPLLPCPFHLFDPLDTN